MEIEPTSEAWEASILPLYDARSAKLIVLRNPSALQYPFRASPKNTKNAHFYGRLIHFADSC